MFLRTKQLNCSYAYPLKLKPPSQSANGVFGLRYLHKLKAACQRNLPNCAHCNDLCYNSTHTVCEEYLNNVFSFAAIEERSELIRDVKTNSSTCFVKFKSVIN